MNPVYMYIYTLHAVYVYLYITLYSIAGHNKMELETTISC